MIHLVLKSHEGNFQVYASGIQKDGKLVLDDIQLHLNPSNGDLMTIDGPEEIYDVFELIYQIDADEVPKEGTIFADYHEQDMEDLAELVSGLVSTVNQ